MSSSTTVSAQPTEHTAIVRLANCFAAVHATPREMSFISDRLETDLKVAQAAAQSFAQKNSIPCCTTPCNLDRAVVTVVKYQNKWFPAKLHSNSLSLVANLGPISFACEEEAGAIKIAKAIAFSQKLDMIPPIGELPPEIQEPLEKQD